MTDPSQLSKPETAQVLRRTAPMGWAQPSLAADGMIDAIVSTSSHAQSKPATSETPAPAITSSQNNAESGPSVTTSVAGAGTAITPQDSDALMVLAAEIEDDADNLSPLNDKDRGRENADDSRVYPANEMMKWVRKLRKLAQNHSQKATAPDIDPADVWDDYLEEVPKAADRSPQGALAFGVHAVLEAVRAKR